MIEIGLALGACYAMYRIADADDESGFLWGGVTFLLCVGSVVFVPLPFLRILGVAIVTFILMMVGKGIRNR